MVNSYKNYVCVKYLLHSGTVSNIKKYLPGKQPNMSLPQYAYLRCPILLCVLLLLTESFLVITYTSPYHGSSHRTYHIVEYDGKNIVHSLRE